MGSTRFGSIVICVSSLSEYSNREVVRYVRTVGLFLGISRATFILNTSREVIRLTVGRRCPIRSQGGSIVCDPFSSCLRGLVRVPCHLPELSFGRRTACVVFLLLGDGCPGCFRSILGGCCRRGSGRPFGICACGRLGRSLDNRGVPSIRGLLRVIPVVGEFLGKAPHRLGHFLGAFSLHLEVIGITNVERVSEVVLTGLVLLRCGFGCRGLFRTLCKVRLLGRKAVGSVGGMRRSTDRNGGLRSPQ